MEAGTLAPHAAEAAEQAERAIPLVEALLALSRPAVSPVDLYETLRPVARLYRAVAEAADGVLELDPAPDPAVYTSAGGDAVRLALASAIEVLVEPGARVRGSVRRHRDAGVVAVAGTRSAALPGELVRSALAAERIMMETDGAAIVLRFPPPVAHD